MNNTLLDALMNGSNVIDRDQLLVNLTKIVIQFSMDMDLNSTLCKIDLTLLIAAPVLDSDVLPLPALSPKEEPIVKTEVSRFSGIMDV